MNDFDIWLLKNNFWLDVASVLLVLITGFISIFNKTRKKTSGNISPILSKEKTQLTKWGIAALFFLIISTSIQFLIKRVQFIKLGMAEKNEALRESRLQNRFEFEVKKLEKLNNDLDTFSKKSSSNDLRNNNKLEESLNRLTGINERIQYPLPKIITTDIKIGWSVKGVNNEFNSIIKEGNKAAIIESAFALQKNFLIDTSYYIFSKLYLAFKSINLKFTKNREVANYHITIWPEKIEKNFNKFYHPYDLNIIKNAYFIYDSLNQYMSFNLSECPALLTSVSPKMSSLYDIDSSSITLEINQDNDDVQNELNTEHPVKYIFGYSYYDANDNHESLLLNANYNFRISFNEMFSVTYHDTSRMRFITNTLRLAH